jgi:hypothetical protein
MIIVNKYIQSHYFIKSNIKKMIDIINKIYTYKYLIY